MPETHIQQQLPSPHKKCCCVAKHTMDKEQIILFDILIYCSLPYNYKLLIKGTIYTTKKAEFACHLLILFTELNILCYSAQLLFRDYDSCGFFYLLVSYQLRPEKSNLGSTIPALALSASHSPPRHSHLTQPIKQLYIASIFQV